MICKLTDCGLRKLSLWFSNKFRPSWLASVSNDCFVNILDVNTKEVR